jgi:glutathione S-transferase
MAAKLYVVPASHPCAMVERALELKGIPYETVNLVPVFHKAFQKARFRSSPTVPGIVLDDGRKIVGSREIVLALEDHPPALFPSDPAERARVEEAERWGNDVLQTSVRRILWCALEHRSAATVSYLGDAKLFPPTPRFAAKLTGKPVAKIERTFRLSSTASRAGSPRA